MKSTDKKIKEISIIEYTYPDPFVKHPDIGHHKMVEKVFPYIKPKQLSIDEYLRYYQATYIALCQDFESYLKYLEEEHWNNFKTSNKKILNEKLKNL